MSIKGIKHSQPRIIVLSIILDGLIGQDFVGNVAEVRILIKRRCNYASS